MDRHYFKAKDAETKVEKLVLELATNLTQTVGVFLKLNGMRRTSKESLHILFNGIMAFTGMSLLAMRDDYVQEENKQDFEENAMSMLKGYLEQQR